MARYTYKEIGDNKDSDCLTTVIYDGMDIMAIIYDYGEEVEVEPKRDLTDEESDMVKQFCESLDYNARQKVNESISIGENVDILDIYKQAREDFGELNQKSSLNESVKKKPETINEKLKRLDRKVFDEEFKTLDLAYNYSMINEDVVGKKVDMKTKQELRDFINREDDPNKIAKFMDVIINGDDNKPNQLNNQRIQQSNIRTENLNESKEQSADIMEIFNRNGWTVMKQGPGLMAYNYVIEHDSVIELNQDALADFLENENHLIDDLDALSEDITFSFNATQEGHPTGTVTDWRRDSVEESLNEQVISKYRGYTFNKRNGGRYLYDIQKIAPYDDADYYWAFSNDSSAEVWTFVYKGKSQFTDEVDDISQVIEALEELNSKIESRMVHN